MKVSLEKIRKILNFFDKLEKNIVNNDELEKVYKILPEELQSNTKNPGVMMTAINRFVILNFLEIEKQINEAEHEDEQRKVKAIVYETTKPIEKQEPVPEISNLGDLIEKVEEVPVEKPKPTRTRKTTKKPIRRKK